MTRIPLNNGSSFTDVELQSRFACIRGAKTVAPEASIVIPVNAKGDLDNVRLILCDLAEYRGQYSVEVILMINNYDEFDPPSEINGFVGLGLQVVAETSVRRKGECVGFSARVRGAQAAASNHLLLFDADCRIPNATALIDWYVAEFRNEAKVAYTHVNYFELRDTLPNRLRILVHHSSRWTKRVLLGIPTVRGSNYAIDRTVLQRLYDEGWLADDQNVGPTCRALGIKVSYSGDQELTVLTSGRMFSGTSWLRLNRYFWRRLRFNLRVLRVRRDAARHTQREFDPERRYVNNRPVY